MGGSPGRRFWWISMDSGVVFGRFRNQKPFLLVFTVFFPRPRVLLSTKQTVPADSERSGLDLVEGGEPPGALNDVF